MTAFRITDYLGWLEETLGRLPRRQQLLFALSGCELLYKGYESHIKSRNLENGLERIRAILVDHLSSDAESIENLPRLMEECQSVELDEEASDFLTAVDAVDAFWLTLRACERDSAQNVTKVAERVLNMIARKLEDDFTRNESIGSGPWVLTPGVTDELLEWTYSHPEFQKEIGRQRAQVGGG